MRSLSWKAHHALDLKSLFSGNTVSWTIAFERLKAAYKGPFCIQHMRYHSTTIKGGEAPRGTEL